MIVILQALRHAEKTGLEAVSPFDLKVIADRWQKTLRGERIQAIAEEIE